MPSPAVDSSPDRPKGPTLFGVFITALAVLLLIGLGLIALGIVLDPPPRRHEPPGLYRALPPAPLAWRLPQSL